ncbi:DUF645 family protein [Vibrio cholerae]|nr:DUF645 family protein [Vibrio cholerae]EJL6441871.1 DUF645 family protein [Vibrio cholerae]
MTSQLLALDVCLSDAFG